MKKKAYLIFLVLGLALLAVGVFFFGRICAVKDSIYANYSLSFSDATSIEAPMQPETANENMMPRPLTRAMYTPTQMAEMAPRMMPMISPS